MAAFSLTYNNIIDSSLKHIYSGNPTNGTITRTMSGDLPPVKKDEHYIPPNERFLLRQSQFWPRWNSSLPRAPAFRTLPKREITHLVDRLSTPIQRHTELKPDGLPNQHANRSKYSQALEHTAVTSHLPTVSSNIRQRIQEGRKKGKFPDIRNCCDRFGTKPSQRYTAPRYDLWGPYHLIIPITAANTHVIHSIGSERIWKSSCLIIYGQCMLKIMK
jgi:hypothetical protein